jgi:hypothetical protein
MPGRTSNGCALAARPPELEGRSKDRGGGRGVTGRGEGIRLESSQVDLYEGDSFVRKAA